MAGSVHHISGLQGHLGGEKTQIPIIRFRTLPPSSGPPPSHKHLDC